ncbi:MAG: hypothetical protein WCJ72_00090 [Chryseobacterium sp.]
MSLLVPDVGEILMLQYLVNMLSTDGTAGTANGQRLLRLFTNNLTPVEATTLATVTEALGGTGYTPVTLVGSSWTTTQVGGTTTAVYSEQTFTFTTGVTVYGYYVTSIYGTPALLWLERFSGAPFILPSGGGQIAISPRISLD